MIVGKNTVSIVHVDTNVIFSAFIITDPRIDFCLAYVRDRQT